MRNVVVGVDGTAASAAALRWAAATVGTRGRLHAVVAVNPWTTPIVDALSGRAMTYREVLERELIDAWTAEIGFAVGELHASVSGRTTAGALEAVALTDDADAIVVGRHRGTGLVKRIGHATNRLLRLTHHPVVVVPTDGSPTPEPGRNDHLDSGDLVVGIGHGDATRSAVRWAAHLARTRKLGLELLHATGDAPVFQASGPAELLRYEFGGGDPSEFEAGRVEHFAALAHVAAGPLVPVTISTPPGLAAHHLVEASKRAPLLVLGRHRSRLDLGHHTSQPLRHALTHARCPVAVIADHPEDELAEGTEL